MAEELLEFAQGGLAMGYGAVSLFVGTAFMAEMVDRFHLEGRVFDLEAAFRTRLELVQHRGRSAIVQRGLLHHYVGGHGRYA